MRKNNKVQSAFRDKVQSTNPSIYIAKKMRNATSTQSMYTVMIEIYVKGD